MSLVAQSTSCFDPAQHQYQCKWVARKRTYISCICLQYEISVRFLKVTLFGDRRREALHGSACKGINETVRLITPRFETNGNIPVTGFVWNFTPKIESLLPAVCAAVTIGIHDCDERPASEVAIPKRVSMVSLNELNRASYELSSYGLLQSKGSKAIWQQVAR